MTATSNKANTRIAFIGLGNMGGPMAKNLLKNGYQVTVYDLSEAAQQQLSDAGASTSSSPKQAVQGADVVITMLPASKHVNTVYLGDAEATQLTADGLLSELPSGTLVIDSSTIDAAAARNVARIATTKGIDMVDAPVSGGTAGAEAGTLTFIVGGEDSAFNRAEPILKAMGKNIFHAGSQWG